MERHRSKAYQIGSSWWVSLFWEFAIGFIIGFSLSCLQQHVLGTPPQDWRINFFFGLLSGLLVYTTIEHVKLRDLPQKIMKSFVENRSAALLRYFHSMPNSRHFELVMMTFDELGSSRWVMSEFINWKLKTDFSSVSEIRIANMDTAEYSRLLCALINVTKESIFMTCPYLPSKWLEEMEIEGELTEDNMPPHLRAFLSRGGVHRVRILNLNSDEFQKLSDDAEKESIARFAKPIEDASRGGYLRNREIIHRALNIDVFNDEQKERWKLDYSVFDASIVVLWRTNGNGANNRQGDCVLVFDNTEVQRYVDLFGLLQTDSSKFKDVSGFHS